MTAYRLKLVIRLIPLLGIVILIRLFYWQIIRGASLSAQATKQHQGIIALTAMRGEILDRNGHLLAGTKNLYHLFVYKPTLNIDEAELKEKLAPILSSSFIPATDSAQTRLELAQVYLESRLKLRSSWISLKHYLTSEQKETTQDLNITGLGFEDEFVRFYPEASLSGQVLGFVGKDTAGQDRGYFGLEGYFDRELQGRSGFVRMDKDIKGRPILTGKYQYLDSLKGRTLQTTIDRNMQYILEKKLLAGIKSYQATASSAIIMESKTGKIRAMASVPNYDPSAFSNFDSRLYKNPNVANLFEPGSTFKVLIMAAALNENLVTPQTKCDICNGPVNIGPYSIKTWNEEYHPGSSMTEVIVNSDNTGMVFVGKKLGTEKFAKYLKLFGFGEKTKIELQEEVSGFKRKARDIKEIDLATMSFGQGIAITPIQLITAVNTIANNGEYVSPTLIESITDSTHKQLKPLPRERHQVLSKKAVSDITAIMIKAVSSGEAKWIAPKNILIAGKTGTAQIPIEGHYDKDKTIASFVGFFPADNPKYTMLVTVSEPQSSPWGSETAAPLWFDLAKELLLM